MIRILRYLKNSREYKPNGFTFIEIILSLALLSILSAIFGMGLAAAMESYAFSRANIELTQKGQLAMQRISRELGELVDVRTAGSDPVFVIYDRIGGSADSTPAKITMGIYYDATHKTIQLYHHLKADVVALPVAEGSQNDNGENMVNTLIDGVDSLSFGFFSGNADWNVGTGVQSALSTIQVQLVLQRPENASLNHTYTTLVQMRNNNNTGGAVVY